MCEQDWFDRLGERITDALAATSHENAVGRVQLADDLRSILRTAVPTLPRSADVWNAGTLTGLSATKAVELAGRNPARVSLVVLNSGTVTLFLASSRTDAELKGSTATKLPAGASVTIDTTAPVFVLPAGTGAEVTWFTTETTA